MQSIAWLRAQALRALGLDPHSIAKLREAAGGVDGNLSVLRKAALRSRGIDPFDREALRRAIGAMPPPPAAVGGQSKPKPRKPRKPRAPKPAAVPTAPKPPKLFLQFLSSGCKNLQLAAKVLNIAAKPPLRRATLRAAWIELIALHHPDRGGATEAAQAVNAAYQLLVKFAY